MTDTRAEILRLTAAWQEFILMDHHKERDGHWLIIEDWAYGEAPTYKVQHFGYVGPHYEGDFGTREKAERALLHVLREAFREQKRWAKRALNDPDEWLDTRGQAEFVLGVEL